MPITFNQQKERTDKLHTPAPAVQLRLDEQQREGNWYAVFSLFSDKHAVPVSEWTAHNHDGARWLTDLSMQSNLVLADDAWIAIPMSTLMSHLTGQQTYLHRLLQLPPLFEGGLEVKGRGLLHDDNFRLSWNWLNSTGRPIHAEQRGGILLVGHKKNWLPDHAYQLATHLKDLQDVLGQRNSFHDRLIELAEFKRVLDILPDDERSRIRQSSDLASLKLFYADSFRIEAYPQDDGHNVYPILLRRRSVDEYSSPGFESVLPPAEEARYAKYFSESTQLLPHYSLGVGKYIIMSDKLTRVLECVHKVHHSSPADRKPFLHNPKAVIAAQLEGVLDEDELESILSDRVIGIGEWQARVIPWIAIPSTEWIPDGSLPEGQRVLQIGDTKITLSQQEAQELIGKVEDAIHCGQPTVEHEGTAVPARNDTVEALKEISQDIPVKPDNYKSPTDPKSGASRPKLQVMLVKQNLETLEFQVHRIPRTNVPSNSGLPDRIRTQPKRHQLEAYTWLCEHYRAGSRGVLLADDMGLGKTYQALMFLSWLREGMERGEMTAHPLLIVAPTGLLKNWEAEIRQHLLNDLGPLVRGYGSDLHGLKDGTALNISRLRNAGLVLTTYETLTRYQTSFSVVPFAAAVLDETQKLKNPGTQNYTASCSLKADFWIGMTGTPIENRLCDLWAITDVVQPGMLGTIKEFSTKYERAVLEDDHLARQRIKELQRGLTDPPANAPAFMLRRMKHEELPGLPEKMIRQYDTLMPTVQSRAYRRVIDEVANNPTKEKGAMLKALHMLRACSLHPDYKREEKYWHDNDFIAASARLMACFGILDEIHSKQEKALIFIEYNDWHRPDFLPALIQRRYALDRLPMVINGQVDSAARQRRVDDFQNRPGVFDVMLISPKAGGVGLTLTAANHVIHLTRWWNPAIEDQATDRIYRIGQERPVYIHYPLAVHPSIPERCFDVLLHKILEGKRRLREQTLLTLPDTTDIEIELMKQTFDVGSDSKLDLADSYEWMGGAFEEYVLRTLQRVAPQFGYRVRPTRSSWDGGADMIVETVDGVTTALIQCKHVSSEGKAPAISADLERAMSSYGCGNDVWKIGITNASKISAADRNWISISNRHLIVSGADGLNPERVIFQKLEIR